MNKIVSIAEACNHLVDNLTDTELDEYGTNPKEVAAKLLERAVVISKRSKVEELWDRTAVAERERILLSVIPPSPERKTTVFGLATKGFTELPIYVKDLIMVIFAKPVPTGNK